MEYLSEKNYDETSKKIKIAGYIIMGLGFVLIILGIYFLISAGKIQEPSMTSSDWFSVSSSKMHRESTGMFMLIPGIFLTVTGVMVRFVMANQKKILAYQMGSVLPVMMEGIEKATPKMTKLAKDVNEEIAPEYGKVAKEVAKGIKEGLKEEK